MSSSSTSTKGLKSVTISGQVSIPGATSYRGIEINATSKSQSFYDIPVAADGSFSQVVKGKGYFTLTAYDNNGSFTNFTRADGVNGDIGPLIAPSTALKVTPKKGKGFKAAIVYPNMPDPITGLPIPGGVAPPQVKEDMGVLEPHVARSGSISSTNESDWYRIGLTGWSYPSFTVNPGGATLSLFDSSGALLANNGINGSFSYPGEPVGTYFLAVSPGATPPSFGYTLSFS